MPGHFVVLRPHKQIARLFPACLLLILGCGTTVQEDRNVNWSQDGGSVSFQHGFQGVFVVDAVSGKSIRVFDVDEKTIAVSTPLWSPTDQRLIFTTARRAEGASPPTGQQPLSQPSADAQKQNPLADWALRPNGIEFRPEPIIYTCWLRAAPTAGDQPKPQLLFEAESDHPGYVGANLAVRWHPDGQRIVFVARDSPSSKLALFTWDIPTGIKSRIDAIPTCEALLIEWSPDRSHLAVLGASSSGSDETGIWIGDRSLERSWWHLPGSASLTKGTVNDLERLRGLLPAWTMDGTRFLSASPIPTDPAGGKQKWRISLGDVTQQSVKVLLESDEPLRAVKWHAGGQQFGYLRGTTETAMELRSVLDDGGLTARIEQVQQWMGWDASGSRLAYVVRDRSDDSRKPHWSLLLIPDRDARHRVMLADSQGGSPRLAFDKMQITFPQWSPGKPQLSLWGTFSPSYRSIISWLGTPWTVRRGDPAFLLDPESGHEEWLAVDPHEKVQVGHYYQLKRDYERAWHWYEDARRDRATPPQSSLAETAWRTLANQQEPSFFEFICLTKLGRTEEAAARLDAFRQRQHEAHWLAASAFPPTTPTDQGQEKQPTPTPEQARALGDVTRGLGTDSLAVPFLQDLYIAEAYLSLDLLADGVAFLQREMSGASTDGERLAHASLLSQLLLIRGDKADFARLLTQIWAPAVLKLKPALPDDDHSESQPGERFSRIAYAGFGGAVLAPLFLPEFVADLPDDTVDELRHSWAALRDQAKDNVERFAIDLVLYTAANRLRRESERNAIAVRLTSNPIAPQWLEGKEVDLFLAEVAESLRQLQLPVQ